MSKELNEEQRKKLNGGTHTGSYQAPTGMFCELKASATGGFCGRQSSGVYDCSGCPSQGITTVEVCNPKVDVDVDIDIGQKMKQEIEQHIKNALGLN